MGSRALPTLSFVLALPGLAAVALAASGTGGLAADGDRLSAVPPRLSQTGLYAADGSVAPGSLPFAPQYPLWSDGAAKSRWVHLPAGTKVDVSDVDAWRFPEGTTFWKEFAFGGRKVETRMIRKTARDWAFATYVWNEDQTDALLAPAEGQRHAAEVAPGKSHSVPAIVDCDACHRGSPAVVLGFSALQLSDDRDPLAPHAEPLRPGMVTLRSLVESDRLAPARRDLALRPPRIREQDPAARAAIGYLSANCGGCHNASGALARLGFSLLHDVAGRPGAPEPAALTAIGARGRYLVPGVEPDHSRVVAPGDPRRSALLYRMRSRRPSSQMPPLGSMVADVEAALLVERWIAGLNPGPTALASR